MTKANRTPGRYVYAIRIFEGKDATPMAELAFGEGGRPTGETTVIPWNRIDIREQYTINAYTFVWDERCWPKDHTFSEYVHQLERKW